MKSCIRQGDNLSTTLFVLVINDLAIELKQSGCGVMNGFEKLCCHFYADDIVIITENEQELQTIIGIIYKWIRKWSLLINYGKTNVLHFRPPNVARSAFSFKCGLTDVDYASSYRCLGCYLNEFLDFKHTAQVLA